MKDTYSLVDIVKFKSRLEKAARLKLPNDMDIVPTVVLGQLNPVDNTIAQPIDSDGSLLVRQSDIKFAAGEVATAASALFNVTEGETWRLEELTCFAIADATVANRAVSVQLHKYGHLAGATYANWTSQSITISASQYGVIYFNLNQDGIYLLNDNGTVTESSAGLGMTRSPMPIILDGDYGDYLLFNSDNDQAGDLMRIWAHYRRIA